MDIVPNPALLPTGISRCVAWSPARQHLAVVHSTEPFVTVYSTELENVIREFTTLHEAGILNANLPSFKGVGFTRSNITQGTTSIVDILF